MKNDGMKIMNENHQVNRHKVLDFINTNDLNVLDKYRFITYIDFQKTKNIFPEKLLLTDQILNSG